MEVAFTSDNSRRRRWSFAGGNLDRTACFVHSLLDNEKHDGLGDIQEDAGPEFDRAADKISVLDFDERRPSQDSGAAVLHSRLLTKKQLTDLALNVRGLSRRLSKIKLRLDVKTVFVLTKVYDESLIENTRQITRWLLSKDRRTPYVVYVEKTLQENGRFDAAGLIAEEPSAAGRLQFWDVPLVQERTFDFVVTLGGDGTVLYASRLFQQIVPPVLSFALGSLGFLTKFDFDRYQQILTEAFRDGVAVSLRLRFECTVMRSQTRHETADEKASKRRDLVEELIGVASKDDMTHAPDQVFQILNEVVVDRGPNPTMSSLEIFGDDQHFTTVQADGICISTPTGSTAYNLAAGGALSHPENPVVLITAICAHTLSFRPIILPDTIVLRVGVPYDARTGSWASFDGRERIELQPGDYVTVSASRYPFAYVMPPDRRSVDWIESISRTLNWNSRKKQKAFEQKESE